MSQTVPVTDTNFEQQVLQSDLPVVVDFWAPWCGPCRIIGPVLDELAREYDSRLTIAKVNVDEHTDWASTLGVVGIPTMIVFRDGQEITRVQGALPKGKLKEAFDAVLTS